MRANPDNFAHQFAQSDCFHINETNQMNIHWHERYVEWIVGYFIIGFLKPRGNETLSLAWTLGPKTDQTREKNETFFR